MLKITVQENISASVKNNERGSEHSKTEKCNELINKLINSKNRKVINICIKIKKSPELTN